MRHLLNASLCINSIGNFQTKLKSLQKIPFLCFVDSSLVSAFLYALCPAEQTDTNVDLTSKLTTDKVPWEESYASFICFLRSCVALLLLIASSLYEWDCQGEEMVRCDRLVERQLFTLIRDVWRNWNIREVYLNCSSLDDNEKVPEKINRAKSMKPSQGNSGKTFR